MARTPSQSGSQSCSICAPVRVVAFAFAYALAYSFAFCRRVWLLPLLAVGHFLSYANLFFTFFFCISFCHLLLHYSARRPDVAWLCRLSAFQLVGQTRRAARAVYATARFVCASIERWKVGYILCYTLLFWTLFSTAVATLIERTLKLFLLLNFVYTHWH